MLQGVRKLGMCDVKCDKTRREEINEEETRYKKP